MNTVLVWVLVTVGGYAGVRDVVYSPPMPDLKTCEHLRDSVQVLRDTPTNPTTERARCVQIRIVVTK